MTALLASARRVVVKVGSALVTNDGRGLDDSALARWAGQIAALQKMGKEVILVSSGAVAEGVLRLGWEKRPGRLYELQAAAAVGQMGLVQAYERHFREHGIGTAHAICAGPLTSRGLGNAKLCGEGAVTDPLLEDLDGALPDLGRMRASPSCF